MKNTLLTACISASQPNCERKRYRENTQKKEIDRVLLIVIREWYHRCGEFQTKKTKPKSETSKTLKNKINFSSEGRILTYNRRKNENDVYGQACPCSVKEGRNWSNINNSSGDGNGGEQLDSNDRVNLPNEGPSELWALQHRRIQRRCSALDIVLPLMIPHPSNANYKKKKNKETKLQSKVFGGEENGPKSFNRTNGFPNSSFGWISAELIKWRDSGGRRLLDSSRLSQKALLLSSLSFFFPFFLFVFLVKF